MRSASIDDVSRIFMEPGSVKLRSARRRAADRGVTLSAFVEDALRAHLARRESAVAPLFRLHTARGRLVRPELDRTSALLALDDEARFGGRG